MPLGPTRNASLEDVTEVAPPDEKPEKDLSTRRPRRAVPFVSDGRRRSALIVAGLVLLLATPLFVALAVLRHPRWYPVADLAQTELRIRDVGTGHPPLIGLAGRIGPLGHQGSHPGPLSFFGMTPVYRLFGATSWAMQAAAVSLHVFAMGAALWIAYRRGGVRLVLGVAAVLAVLLRAYGVSTLTEAWNPYLPVLWWLVFLLAVWSVVCDDLPLLPVAVVAGSMCVQTHVPYGGLVLGLGIFAVIVAFFRAYVRRQRPQTLRRFARWSVLSLSVGVVLWLPPVIEQFTTSPGNFSVLRDYFLHPPETPVGPRRGLEVLLVHLNPWNLVAQHPRATTGSLVPGVLFLAAWAATAVIAIRLRHRSIMRLNLVLGVALVLSAGSMSRIFGLVWYYLVLWAWGINVLMLLAMGWTLCVVFGRRFGELSRNHAAIAGTVVLAGVVVVSSASFAIDAADARSPEPRLSKTVGALVPQTVRALDRVPAPNGGRNGRYLVTFTDPVSIGAQGFGLLNELDRRGFDVGVVEVHGGGATTHRVLDPAEATAVVHLSIGPDIEVWRAKPGAQLVAYVEPRSRKERDLYERLRSEAIDQLQGAGLLELADSVDTNLFTTILNTRVPKPTKDRLAHMLKLGLPAAVFVGPPGTA
jgi:hypothetical protein